MMDKYSTRLPSIERTLASQTKLKQIETVADRYSYIRKADYESSSKEIVLKKSDKTKSDLISFMLLSG